MWTWAGLIRCMTYILVWAKVNLNKVCTSNNWSDPTRSTSMWHHTGVKPQLCLSPGEFKQSSQTSDGTQPSPHRCYITLRCVMLCLNSPALGPSCGFSPVWCHIDVDLVGSHPMLDVHTLFQFTWAQLPIHVYKIKKKCLPKSSSSCLFIDVYTQWQTHTLWHTRVWACTHTTTAGGGRRTQKPYLSKSTDIFQEKGPGKSKRPPIEYDLSKSLPLSDINCT